MIALPPLEFSAWFTSFTNSVACGEEVYKGDGSTSVSHDHGEPTLNTVLEATWGGAGRPNKGHAHLTKPTYNKPSNKTNMPFRRPQLFLHKIRTTCKGNSSFWSTIWVATTKRPNDASKKVLIYSTSMRPECMDPSNKVITNYWQVTRMHEYDQPTILCKTSYPSLKTNNNMVIVSEWRFLLLQI
jgi:hypothetical protein